MKKIKLAVLACVVLSTTVFSQKGQEPPGRKTEVVNNTGGVINLISPANGKLFNNSEGSKPVLFRWSAIIPKPKEPVTYRLRVWQLMQGQNGTEAMRSNQPVVSKDVANITQAAISNLYTGPCKPPYLCDFIWSVEALSSENMGTGKNYGISGANTFKIHGIGTVTGSGGATVDIKSTQGQGDPIHGVDIKLGFETKSQCDPIHGVDIKLGITARNAQGDPIHGVDIKPGITATNAQGEPVHGVDVKLGAITKSLNAQGEPVHGVDVKLGAIAKNQGEPVHGVDVKLGFEGKKADLDQIQSVDLVITVMTTNAQGEPVHGVDVKLGAVAKNAQGEPVHGVDVKPGLKNQAQGEPVHGVDVKLGAVAKKDPATQPNHNFPETMRPHPHDLPIEKITYDAAGNIVEIVLRSNEGAPVPKVVVAGSHSLSGGRVTENKNCKTIYCHDPKHPPGCGWLECK